MIENQYLFHNRFKQMGRMFAYAAYCKTYAAATSLHDSYIPLISFAHIRQYWPHLQTQIMV